MSSANFFALYLNLNLLIATSFIALKLLLLFFKMIKLTLSARDALKLHYLLLMVTLMLSAIHPLLPHNDYFSPVVTPWSASGAISSPLQETGLKETLSIQFSDAVINHSSIRFDDWTLLTIFALIIIIAAFSFFRELARLKNIRRSCVMMRKIGKVSILVSEQYLVPFSFWLPGQAYVILPVHLLYQHSALKISLLHELQHHRQRDTLWAFVLFSLKMFCFLNPFLYFWNHWITETQEFACDETLVDQKKVDSQAYARCLVQVAQTSFSQKGAPACATGLISMTKSNLLKRRIQKMFLKSSIQASRLTSMICCLLLSALLASATMASKSFAQTRRITLTQARALTEKAQSDSGFSIVINEAVVRQLNRYLVTPSARDSMREILNRKKAHYPQVQSYLTKYGLPEELAAVPIIESGYQNLPETQNSAWPHVKAAGLWQFIRSTARSYGLIVNETIDERLNTDLSTDAAMRYLESNYLRFKDWHLAALAYNMGEQGVQKGIDATGSRDAWQLISKGYEGDKHYLPKLMAAILIMRNPELVK